MLSNEKLKKEIASIYSSKKFFWTYGFTQSVASEEDAILILQQLKKITCSLCYHFVGIRIMLVGPNAASVKVKEDNQWKFYFLSGKYRYNKEMVCKDGAKLLSCYYFSGLEQMSQLINVVTGKVIPQNQTGENATLYIHNLTEAVTYHSVLAEVEADADAEDVTPEVVTPEVVTPEEEAKVEPLARSKARPNLYDVESSDEEDDDSDDEAEVEADDEAETEVEAEVETEVEAEADSEVKDDVPVEKLLIQKIIEISKLPQDKQLAEIAKLQLN